METHAGNTHIDDSINTSVKVLVSSNTEKWPGIYKQFICWRFIAQVTNRKGLPQGFSLNPSLHKLNTILSMPLRYCSRKKMTNRVRGCWYRPLTVSVWRFNTRLQNNRMDKNNCKLKILYKCTYHQIKYSSPNHSNKQKQEPHKKLPTFRKMEVSGKRGQENGPKAEKDNTERANGLGRRTREEI